MTLQPVGRVDVVQGVAQATAAAAVAVAVVAGVVVSVAAGSARVSLGKVAVVPAAAAVGSMSGLAR